MYENLSEKRKQELDTLREWAVCAGLLFFNGSIRL